MINEVKHSTEARDAIVRGVDIVANAVKVTLGPKGRVAMLDRGYGAPMVTKDGVTVAKVINPKDRFENMGAELIKEVAGKTNDVAGDGTTTATVLAQALIHEGLGKFADGMDAQGVRQYIEEMSEQVIKTIRSLARPVREDEIEKIATISANNAEIGKLVAEAISKVKVGGVVTVEQSKTFNTEVDVVEGTQFDRGYLAPMMVTNIERSEVELENPFILITDQSIVSQTQIVPLMEKMVAAGHKELLIIAENVEGEALATCVVNKVRGLFTAIAVRTPGFGDQKSQQVQDIAILTGATIVSESAGIKFQTLTLEQLGRADRVIVGKEKTTLVGGRGDKEKIEARIKAIETERNNATDFQKEKLQERLNKMIGGIAVIRVGASTETEMTEKKHRVIDAVAATQAALEEGIVPGGGVAFVDALREMQTGAGWYWDALFAPLTWIVRNAGKEPSEVIKALQNEDKRGWGYNAATDQYGFMEEMGIIDPAKVTISALRHAASIATMVLTTEAAVGNIEEIQVPGQPR